MEPLALREETDTGKRISRLNPEAEWMRKEVPELRIVPDDLWSAAKSRQQHTRHTVKTVGALGAARRPQYLFSPADAGTCGAGFIMSGKNRLGCFGVCDQRRCDNHLTIRRDEVEARVLRALQAKLLQQDLFEEFCDEFTREMNRLRMVHRASLSAAERELERVQSDIRRVIEAIKNGFAGPDLKRSGTRQRRGRRRSRRSSIQPTSRGRCCIQEWRSCIARR